MKLTDAQRRYLRTVPDEWGEVPMFGDRRPLPPLIRAGLVEERRTVVGSFSIARTVRVEYRRTDSGRAMLKEAKGND